MNLFELFVKIGAKDEASGTISKITKGLGKGLATAAKIGTAAVGAAAAGITALTKAAVNNYAEYEQLVGGAQLMFGKAYETVSKNAQDAYKTVQMSQNEYLQQANGFATGLKTALGGNEEAAADLAHRIIQAEADIVAATGNTQENVANAFNGIMKSNFTMLDNLQIGITPTKEGFQEVIDKVNEWNKANGEATNYQMGNLADMQSALVDYIDMVDMSGYAQREASETITGSISSMKAALANLVTGFADDSADLDKLIGNLTDSVVGYTDESGKQVKGVLDNLLPAIEKSLGGIAKLIEGAAPKIIEILPGLIEELLPVILTGATDLVNAVTAILPDLLNTVVESVIQNAPVLITAGLAVVTSLIDGIRNNYQVIIDGAISIMKQLVTGILGMLPQIMALGMDLLIALADGVTAMLGDEQFVQSIVDIVLQIVDVLTKPETITNILNAATTLIVALAKGLILALPQLLAKVPEILRNLGSAFSSFLQPVIDIGKNIVDGIKRGISNAWNNLVQWFSKLFDDIIGIAKRILGIASPSKVFKKIGGFTAEGFGLGFEKEFAHVKDDMEDALSFDDTSFGIDSSIRTVSGGMASGGTSIGNINITVNGAKYTDEQSLAAAIALEIQNMTDRRAAVYA